MTIDHRDQFLRDGFTRVDSIADEHELDQLRELYDRMFSDDAIGVDNRKQLGGTDEQGRDLLPQIIGADQKAPELLQTEYYGRCEQVARTIFGDEVKFRGAHMILKPAGYGSPTPWHQDQAYHDPAYHYRNVNFWLPLNGATIESGCMQFVRRTHTGAIVPHRFLNDDPKQATVAQDQDYWQANATPVPCDRGSVTLHHSYCMHYAGPNTTDEPRRALIFVFVLDPEPLERPWVLPWQQEQA